tara:strand:+ start:25 stop:459 length:435 start_codon:yes stop_codon:yes gene_type:complete
MLNTKENTMTEDKLLTFEEWFEKVLEDKNNVYFSELKSEDKWGRYSQYVKNHKHFWELDSNSTLSIFHNYIYAVGLENFIQEHFKIKKSYSFATLKNFYEIIDLDTEFPVTQIFETFETMKNYFINEYEMSEGLDRNSILYGTD